MYQQFQSTTPSAQLRICHLHEAIFCLFFLQLASTDKITSTLHCTGTAGFRCQAVQAEVRACEIVRPQNGLYNFKHAHTNCAQALKAVQGRWRVDVCDTPNPRGWIHSMDEPQATCQGWIIDKCILHAPRSVTCIVTPLSKSRVVCMYAIDMKRKALPAVLCPYILTVQCYSPDIFNRTF